MASAASEGKGKALEGPRKRTTFLDLPIETQREIVSHCSQSDFICLSLVSRHFRTLAASQLYRIFYIVFPDEDDPTFDTPIDGLAGGLDTFVTSDYDYAQHLRDMCLDTLSGGERGEKAYKPYLYTESCGKFMNTLLLLTLQKATCLESFKWNIRVELSRAVYRVLHRISTLSNLHIRMQAGPSLYESPPRLPLAPSTGPPVASPPPMSWIEQAVTMPPPPPANQGGPPPTFGAVQHLFTTGPPPPFPTAIVPHYTTPPPPMPKAAPKPKLPRRVSMTNEPPTLSGFKNLKSLAVLDIDSLDLITELKACIRNSEGTLSHLKVSFSDALASKSRKPPPDNEPEDSDVDDEFQVVPVPASSGDSGGPAKAFRAQEEKRTQETILGRIFGVDQFVVKNTLPERPKKDKSKEEEQEEKPSPEDSWVSSIRLASRKLLAIVKDNDPTQVPGLAEKEVLDIIVEAAKKYTASDAVKKSSGESHGPPKSTPTTGDATPIQQGGSSTSDNVAQSTEGMSEEAEGSHLFMSNGSAKKSASKGADSGVVDPKDIDISDAGDAESLGCSSDEEDAAGAAETAETADTADTAGSAGGSKVPETLFGDNRASSSSASSRKQSPGGNSARPEGLTNVATATIEAQRSNHNILRAKLHSCSDRVKHLTKELVKLRDNADPDSIAIDVREAELQDVRLQIRIMEQDIKAVQAEILDAQKQVMMASEEARNRSISDYIKSTRGLRLKSLALHLIPVRPSVLSRAVDLHVLEELTLLNVGNQAAIWILLAKENAVQPLALRKIYTDNVNGSFLKCVSELREVTELFMLERSSKYKPESFAPRSRVSIDQIRKFILKRHLPTLKYLMIRNDYTITWDVDERAMVLICQQGRRLEELTISLGIRSVHMLCQHMSSLVRLRALNIAHFRNDDTCVWVMRETRKFIVDMLANHPNLKLEWISVGDDRAVQVTRNEDQVKRDERKNDRKGKGKATALLAMTVADNGHLPMMPALDDLDSADSSDEDMDEELKVRIHEDRHFYDTWGVKSFEKEIMLGKL